MHTCMYGSAQMTFHASPLSFHHAPLTWIPSLDFTYPFQWGMWRVPPTYDVRVITLLISPTPAEGNTPNSPLHTILTPFSTCFPPFRVMHITAFPPIHSTPPSLNSFHASFRPPTPTSSALLTSISLWIRVVAQSNSKSCNISLK